MGSGTHPRWSRRCLSCLPLLLLLPGFMHQISANIVQVIGVLNGMAELPCDLTAAPDDLVNLILWYKNETKSPIYSLDFRTSRSNPDAASHNPSDAMASRAFLRVNHTVGYLQLKPVEETDEGLYRCRVDFRKSPTRNQQVNLTVIVPPTEAYIVDEAGQVVTSPYLINENSKLILSCEVVGGRPTPWVKWWKGTKLLRDSYEESSPGKIRSDLIINRITRKDVNTNFTCQASNTNLTVPISQTIALDVSLRPVDIKILGKRDPLSAGKRVNLTCRTTGSRPNAIISWHKNSKRLTKHKETSTANSTVSVLSFIPAMEDNGKFIMCRAENPRISDSVIEDSWNLDVYFAPTASLELGTSLKEENLKEGDDVYFECTIKANPKVFAVDWKFEGRPLHYNISAGIIISNQSLVIQKVKRTSAGSYTCVARNVEGDGESNAVILKIKHAPVCRTDLKQVYGVARREQAKIVCEVSAVPHEGLSFYWSFNNSFGRVDIAKDKIVSAGVRSTAIYSPMTENDYGILLCWARNAIGTQHEPCAFNITAAGPPDLLNNCTIHNQTEDALHVECSEGFDGGMQQFFIMEVYDVTSHQLKSNITSPTPVFQVNGLEPGTDFTISVYAANAKGKGENLTLRASTLNAPERQTAPARFAVAPILGVLIGVVAALVLVAIIIVIVMRFRAPDIEKKGDGDSESIEKSHVSLKKELEEFDNSDEKNPDVVPNEDDCFLRFDVCDNIIDINDAVYADVEDKIDHKLNNINSRIYENVHNSGTNDSENMYENVNNIRNQHGKPKLNKQPEDITYAELQLPNNQRNNTIRRVTEPTVYAQIDHTRKAAPPTQEHEDDEPPTAETPLMNSHRESTV